MLRSCGLNARLVRNTEGEFLREMKESLLIIKTTEVANEVKRFKSFRLHKAKGLYKSGNFAGVKLSQA